MQGRPVWLASISKRDLRRDVIIPNTRWPEWYKKKAIEALWQVLGGVGDRERGWRMFRMNITYCLHLAVSDEELEILGPQWAAIPGMALAGGPIQILDSGNCQTNPSTLPCDNPRKSMLPTQDGKPQMDPDMWFPEDCGICESCLDRIRIEQLVGA